MNNWKLYIYNNVDELTDNIHISPKLFNSKHDIEKYLNSHSNYTSGDVGYWDNINRSCYYIHK